MSKKWHLSFQSVRTHLRVLHLQICKSEIQIILSLLKMQVFPISSWFCFSPKSATLRTMLQLSILLNGIQKPVKVIETNLT